MDFFTGAGSNREIKDCIIIDNNIYCFEKHLTNGLFIPKYVLDDSDDWLQILLEYILDKVVLSEDVRKVIGVDFNFESIAANSRTSQIRQMMNKHLVIEEMQQQ